MIGKLLEDAGMNSEMMSKLTHNDRNTVIPNPTFSPESEGKRKATNARPDISPVGMTRFIS